MPGQAYKTYRLGGEISELLYSPATYGIDLSRWAGGHRLAAWALPRVLWNTCHQRSAWAHSWQAR